MCDRKRASRECSRSAGFTLLETLVALAICGLVIGTLAPMFAMNARRVRSVDDRLAVIGAGHRLLETLPSREQMTEGVRNGMMDGVRWRLEATALPLNSEVDQAQPWIPYKLVIELSANDFTRRIETIRLGRSRPK